MSLKNDTNTTLVEDAERLNFEITALKDAIKSNESKLEKYLCKDTQDELQKYQENIEILKCDRDQYKNAALSCEQRIEAELIKLDDPKSNESEKKAIYARIERLKEKKISHEQTSQKYENCIEMIHRSVIDIKAETRELKLIISEQKSRLNFCLTSLASLLLTVETRVDAKMLLDSLESCSRSAAPAA